MHIAYVCVDAGVPVFGSKGCSIHVQEITRAMLRQGNSVELMATRIGGPSPPDLAVKLCDYSLPPSLSLAERELAQIAAAERIADYLAVNRFDLLYERYSLWSAAPMQMAARCGIPSILEVNAPLIEEQLRHREMAHETHARQLRDEAFAAAGTIIAVSEGVANYVRQHLAGNDQHKVHVVTNGVDVDRFSPLVEPVLIPPAFTIGFLGTLKPWHGIETLLAAFEIVHQAQPGARLRIIGDGPLRSELESKVQEDCPQLTKAIDWVGAVTPDQVPAQLAALDVAVAPYPESKEFYFSPLKVFEYMASGCAVVASDIGQLQGLIQHRVNGYLYPPGDVAELAERLLELSLRPALCEQLGQAARLSMVAKHTWNSTLSNILQYASSDQPPRPLIQSTSK